MTATATTTTATTTATRLYALIAALLFAALALLAAPAAISHFAPASHPGSSFTTTHPDNWNCKYGC
jgi:hypothetical protein